MFSRLRKEDVASTGVAHASRIEADLSGAVINGQVAIGDHIVQIHAEHGAVVNYLAAEQRPVPRLRAGPVRRLPRDFPMLLGREPELAAASAQTSSGESVEFFGPPGIGKTALLRHLAHRLGGEAPDPVLFTWCARQPIGDLQQFLFECLYECDSQIVPTPSDLVRYLQDQRALVLLDDVALERSELGRLMDTLPTSVFVCASDTRRLWGEGRAIELAGLGAAAAVGLIEGELDRTLDAHERETLSRLSATLHGNPLALLTAAGPLFPPPSPAGPSPRIDLSAGARLLEALAALPGVPVATTDLAAVTEIADAARELSALEARHLVQAHSPRYSLTAEAPGPPEEETATRWRRRMLNHFIAHLSPPGSDRERALRAEWAAPPILALLAWAEDERRPGDVLALTRSADGLLALGCRWGAWGVALEHALRAARSLGDRSSEAWALHQLGSRALCLEDTAGAAASLTNALRLREELGDELGAALTRHNLDLLDGGPPGPPGDGPRWPRPPILALLILLALVASVSAAVILPGRGTRQISAPDTVPPTATAPPANGPPTTTGSPTAPSTTTGSPTATAPPTVTAPLTDTAPVTDTAPATDTAPVTDTAPLTDTAPVTDTAPPATTVPPTVTAPPPTSFLR